MPAPVTVAQVVARLREIDRGLPGDDGVAVFNRVYLTVTERILARLEAAPVPDPVWSDPAMIADLDVRFALLWLAAYDDDVAGRRTSRCWAPLFESRRGGRRWPIQYALAGMNAHIEHDLPLAVVATCSARGLEPDRIHRDYEAVNTVLAEVEREIRRAFMTEVGQVADDLRPPVLHLVSAWSIDKARDLAWVTAETLWTLRTVPFLRDRFLDGLDQTVGMGSRTLLAPTGYPAG